MNDESKRYVVRKLVDEEEVYAPQTSRNRGVPFRLAKLFIRREDARARAKKWGGEIIECVVSTSPERV